MNMTTKITINDQMVKAATAALTKAEGIDQAVSIEVDGITAVLSPDSNDMLSPLEQIKHDGTTYYLGLPSE